VQAIHLVAQAGDRLVVFVWLVAQIVTGERILVDLDVGVELQERPHYHHSSSESQSTVYGQPRTPSVQFTVETRSQLYRIRRRDPPNRRGARASLLERQMER
jgi:hypothetical protein